MKILVDGRPLLRPWMGGVPRLTASLLPALMEAFKPHEVKIVSTGLENSSATKRLPNKLVAFLTWSGLSSFDRLFADENADALFLPNLEFVGKPRIPYTLLVHDLSFLIEPRWFDWKSRLWHIAVKPKQLIRQAARLFTVSETTKCDLKNILSIPTDRITVIPLGLDQTPAAETKRSDRYILCLGASGRRKNTECVIAAHRELIKIEKYKDVKLVMTGTPELPRPSYPELFALMRDASAFCYPSWYEGFGMPLHEAARFGTPCISSTAGSLPETAPDGTLFASPAKPHQWLEAMCQILDNPEKHRTRTILGDWTSAAKLISEKTLSLVKL